MQVISEQILSKCLVRGNKINTHFDCAVFASPVKLVARAEGVMKRKMMHGNLMKAEKVPKSITELFISRRLCSASITGTPSPIRLPI